MATSANQPRQQTTAGGVVRGIVYDAGNVATPNLIVRAFDKDLRSEQLLGEAVTDASGSYMIRYERPTYEALEKAGPDLLMRVFDPNGTQLFQTDIDDVVFNAPATATIDIHLRGYHQSRLTEFERLARELEPLLGKTPPDDLQENDTNRDITFLSKETGWSFSYLEYFAVAFKMQQQFQLPPIFSYALFRKGTLLKIKLDNPLSIHMAISVNADLQNIFYSMVLADPADITADIRAAEKELIIPSFAKQLNEILARLKPLREEAVRYVQNDVPKKLIGLMQQYIDSGTHIELLKLSQEEFHGDISALWDRINSLNLFKDTGRKREAAMDFNLGSLLGPDEDMVTHARKSFNISAESDVARLARLDKEGWKNVLNTHPDERTRMRMTDTSRLEQEADKIMSSFAHKFPSTAFLSRLERDEKTPESQKKEISALLDKHPGLNLNSAPVDTLLKDTGASEEVKSSLRTAQRLFRLSPDFNKVQKMRDENIHSAQHIAVLGETQFVKKFTENGTFDAKQAKQVFQKASDISTAAAFLAAELKDYAASADMELFGGKMLTAKIQAVSANFPNYKKLFAQTDLCECEHCRSIYSPAAYLADVLQFLKHRLLMDGTHAAKDVLFERRPDLGDIDLNCDNANTPVPYIDLVCEILEEALSPDPGLFLNSTFDPVVVDGGIQTMLYNALRSAGYDITTNAIIYPQHLEAGIVTFILRDKFATVKIKREGTGWRVKNLRQTHYDAATLAAVPEYVNTSAYVVLQGAQSRFTLPFDYFHEEGRAMINVFDTKRSDLMETFQTGGIPSDSAIAAEYLGISDGKRNIIFNAAATAAQQAIFWNTGILPLILTVQEVENFLNKSGLEYKELMDLLTLGFINPTDNLFIQHLDESCSTSQKIIANLDVPALDRMHRFIRLLRMMGWTQFELDRAITYALLGNNLLNDDTLRVLADLSRLKNSLALSNEKALSLYGLMPDDTAKSIYQTTWLNKGVTSPVEEAFKIESIIINEGLAPGTQDLLENHIEALRLCLRRTEDDVNFLIDKLKALPTDQPPLTRANLAFLYRNHILAQALKVPLADMYTYADLTGLALFASPSTTLEFAEKVRFAQTTGLKLADLLWFLRNEDATGKLGISDADIKAWLEQLQKAYQDSYNTLRSTFDATLDSDENSVPLRAVLASLPPLGADDVNKLMSIVAEQWNDSSITPDAFIDSKLLPMFDTTDIKNKRALLAAALPANKEAARNDLIQSMMESASVYLFNTSRIATVNAMVQQKFNLSEVLTEVLLNNAHLKDPVVADNLFFDLLTTDAFIDKVNPVPVLPAIVLPAFDSQYRTVRLLAKMIQYINKLTMTAAELQWWITRNGTMGWLELDRLRYQNDVAIQTFADWEEFHIALQLMQSYGYVPDPNDITLTLTLSWQNVWEKVATGAPKTEVLDILSQFTGWNTTDVNDLDAHFTLAYPADYRLPQTYQKLDKATAALRLLGVPISEAKNFIQPALTAPSTAAIRKALRAKYTEEQWLDVMKPVQDELRPQKRDALVTWLLADNPSLKDSNDLFDYFLVDVELSQCQPSSRIVLAHGTVQLFAQRCLLGIEPNAIANRENDSGWDQWKWMANYRVWEANRKIFTYPENWMEPTLRDDKSYFYTELEEELQQDEVTDRAVEDAAIHYLDKLDDVASLDVRACYYDVKTYTEHVFARVPGGSTYYYRTFVKERSWTPWIKVDVDISGDHLLAYVRNKRLYLAWPLLTEEVKRDETQSFSLPFTNQTPPIPKKRYQVQLAVSEYVNTQWQPKRLSQNTLPTEYMDEVTLAQKKDTLRLVNLDMGSLAGYGIMCTFDDDPIGIFSLTGCKGYPEAFPSSGSLPFMYFIPQFDQTSFRQMQYREDIPRQNGDTLSAQYIISPFSFQTITNNTPGIFRVTYPHQVSLIDWLFIIFEMWLLKYYKTGFNMAEGRAIIFPLGSFMPFFYADANRRYVIVPGFYDKEGNNGRTFSDIHKFVSDVIALAIKYIQKLFDNPPPTLSQLQAELNGDSEFIRLKAEWEYYKTHQPQLMYRNFYHPLVCFIKSTVYDKGLPGIYKYSVQSQKNSFNFNSSYNPTSVVALPYPIEDIDFSAEGSYSSYNWELFFHLPFFIATQLTQNQKFEDAHKWFHYIFNPLGAESGPVPQKYWVTKPFHEFFDYIDQRIDTIMTNLASDPTGTVFVDLVHAVDDWRDQPFMPYVVGRARPLSFQKAVVMKYMDNLIGWGDNLLRQDTTESVAQATQFYILAARLLGPKPRIVPPAVPTPFNTYNQLEVKLDAFSNALLDIENLVPDFSVLPHEGEELPPNPINLSALYFCIPANDQLLAYWDTIADRLYKVRNCQNIEGVERVLALFAPPIDPAMLVRAAAAGLDISTVISDMNAPLPIYRYTYVSQKAIDLVQEVKYLGAAMISVLERKDAEALSLLRQTQETNLLKAVLEVRKKQIDEAETNIEMLELTKEVAAQREQYYGGREFMNEWEITQAAISGAGIISEIIATVLDATSGGTHMIPIITGGGAGFGGSPVVTVSFGGNNVGSSTGRFATLFRGIAGILHSTAGLIGNIGAYKRREDEWDFQKDQAIAEQKQIQKQIDAAKIRKDIAELEKDNQELQIQQSKDVEKFLKTKFTNKELYTWMQGQLATVFFQSYKLAYDMAKQAEQTYRYELATDSNFIKFGYWDSLKKGLLSGEKLMLDVKRMDSSYMQKNKRDKELTKHISLASLSPMALTQLRSTGKCSVDIPELIFDMDYPGQYMRRLKSVSISIPCVAGPYTTVACRLAMVSNRYRKNTVLKSVGGPMEKYMEEAGNDDRFVYNPSAIQSIATSNAQNDDGLFELNFRDERYLPFEGAGAIGTWSLDMNDPSLLAQFDYQSITDVILHFQYTARDGGSKFKKDTVDYLKPYLTQIADNAPAEGLFRAFDLKHELPNEWHKFMTDGSADFTASMNKEVFPWFTHNNLATLSIKRSSLFFIMKEDVGVQVSLNGGAAVPMIKNASKFGNNVRYLDFTDFSANLVSMSDSTNFTIHVNNFGTLASKIENIWLIHNYGYQLP